MVMACSSLLLVYCKVILSQSPFPYICPPLSTPEIQFANISNISSVIYAIQTPPFIFPFLLNPFTHDQKMRLYMYSSRNNLLFGCLDLYNNLHIYDPSIQ